MIGLFSNLSNVFNISKKINKVSIDNLAAKFHYRATCIILLVATIILCAQQYIGDAISCLQASESKIPEKLLNTYCFYFGTLSLKEKNKHFPNHPGIGPYVDIGSLNTNTYYQWVPFYLFFLAITFYSPHYFWKLYEGERLKTILTGFEVLAYSVTEQYVNGIPNIEERNNKIKGMAHYLCDCIKYKINRKWGIALILTEIYTLIHIVCAYMLTDLFLGGDFSFMFLNENKTFTEVFPTLTMCTFHTYGPTGGIQRHESICLLALNNVNEKIFFLLQFWFPFVLIISALAVLWRFLCLILCRSLIFNRFLFKSIKTSYISDQDRKIVLSKSSFCDWLFLCYLRGNTNGFVFQEVYSELAKCIAFETGCVKPKIEASAPEFTLDRNTKSIISTPPDDTRAVDNVYCISSSFVPVGVVNKYQKWPVKIRNNLRKKTRRTHTTLL